MPLTWSLNAINDWREITQIVATWDDPMRGIEKGQKIMSPVTESIIFATMAVGMGSITEANHEQFFLRLRYYQMLFPESRMSFGKTGSIKTVMVTLGDIKKHIGLSTNVTNETESKWRKRIIQQFNQDTIRCFSNERTMEHRIQEYYNGINECENIGSLAD